MNLITKAISEARTNYFDKLERELSTENPNSRLFWKTSKQLLNTDKHSTNIPTLSFNREYAEDDDHKANMLNNYFSMQIMINDHNK